MSSGVLLQAGLPVLGMYPRKPSPPSPKSMVGSVPMKGHSPSHLEKAHTVASSDDFSSLTFPFAFSTSGAFAATGAGVAPSSGSGRNLSIRLRGLYHSPVSLSFFLG